MIAQLFKTGAKYSRCGYTAISGKVVGKNVHATIPQGNMGYDPKELN